jgi:restriction endonuclease S subunit
MKRDNAYDSTRLVEVASISAGYPFRGKIEKLPDGEVAVIQMRNASPESGVDWDALIRVELPRLSEKALLQPGDIILSTRGGRNYAYCIERKRGLLVCSPHFFIIRLMRDNVLPEFLAWQMNQTPAQNYFAAGATGTHILNLKRGVVERLPIKLPSYERQCSIVELANMMRAERKIFHQLIENRTNEMNAIAHDIFGNSPQDSEQPPK